MSVVSPTLWLECQQAEVEVETGEQVAGLLTALGRVKDWRKPRGIRYPLAPVLALWVAANIAGHDVSTAVWEWAMRLPVGVLRGFGITGRVPSERTFRRLAEEGPPGRLDDALSGWITDATPTPGAGEGIIPVTFDGKVMKGARSFTGPGSTGSMRQDAVVEAIRHDTGTALGHELVVGGDEIECVKSLVKHIFDQVPGELRHQVLITTDSLHSHEPLARLIGAKGGHWLFCIKGNQPTVHANLAALPWKEFENLHVTWDKAHGRTEERALKAMTPTSPGMVGFWGTRQAIKLARTSTRKKTVTSPKSTSSEEFYLVTSLPAEQASPADLAAWARGHWKIEAVHHVRDRTMDEDRHAVRTKHAALNWAIVRDTTISALRLAGYTNMKQAHRATAADVGLVLQIIAQTSQNASQRRL